MTMLDINLLLLDVGAELIQGKRLGDSVGNESILADFADVVSSCQKAEYTSFIR